MVIRPALKQTQIVSKDWRRYEPCEKN